MRAIGVASFAKINLGLEVLGKRDDGFHDIHTIFARISLCDLLYITVTDTPSTSTQISLDCRPSLGIDATSNLVYKAASLLFAERNFTGAAHIVLEKRIPAGAGLGGGSGNAAATLIGLSDLLYPSADNEDLRHIARQLGSDVPYFLTDNAAIGAGRGEQLEYFDLSLPYWAVVVFPGIHISTAWAYSALNISGRKTPTDLKTNILQAAESPHRLRETLHNDFEHPVFAAYPEIAGIKDQLYSTGAIFAQMSGSGSAVYGLFDLEEQAVAASAAFDNYSTYICPPYYQ